MWNKIFSRKYIEPQAYIQNRVTMKKRRAEQFKLLDKLQAPIDERVYHMSIRQLYGQKNLLYAFAKRAQQFQHLGALADINIERVIDRPHDIPFSVKDQLRVKGMASTCGYTHSSEVVQMLEAERMVAYTHSNVPQGLWGIESNNHLFGVSVNPYNPKFVSGGSSGGEGALVSMRCSAFGLGSDSAGSVRIPASFCGVYSFKPSGSKRLSRNGRISLSGGEGNVVKDIDPCMGFVTKSVEDIQYLCSKTIGRTSSGRDWNVHNLWDNNKYQETLKKKLRVGYMIHNKTMRTAPAIQNAIHQTVEKLKNAGHHVQQFRFDDIHRFMYGLLKLNSTPGIYKIIGNRLAGQEPVYQHKEYVQMKRMGDWTFKVRELLEPELERKKLFNMFQPRSIAEYFATVAELEKLKTNLVNEWVDEQLDILISPTVPFTALLRGHSRFLVNMLGFGCFQTMLEMPSGVIPVRLVKKSETTYNDDSFYGKQVAQSIRQSQGLPVSIQISGRSYKDEETVAAMKIIQDLMEPIPLPNPLNNP